MFRPKHVPRSIAIGISLAFLGFLLPGLNGQAQSDVAKSATKPASAASADTIRQIGSDSCVARGCHGAVGASDAQHGKLYLKGGEATTWASFDPHSRAYDVLLNPRSVRIAKLLSKDLGGKPAHQAKLCLDCHSIGGEPTVDQINTGKNPFTSGVDCETCHGPASAWLEPHLTADWPARKDKEKLGYRSLVDVSSRTQLCVTCHVGNSSKEVNHDLIAAGHPRLIFEQAAYQKSLPRHWQEPFEKPGATVKAGDFHAKSWAVGQLATLLSGLDLLQSRAEAAKTAHGPWPEFTEYDCYACHHQLANPSWRQADKARAVPGVLPWGAFSLPPTSALAKHSGGEDAVTALTALKAEMSRPLPDAVRVASLAGDASKSVKAWQGKVDAFMFDGQTTHSLLQALLDPDAKPFNWDEAVGRLLAASALSDAFTDITGKPVDPAFLKQSAELRKLLGFPESGDSPKGFHP